VVAFIWMLGLTPAFAACGGDCSDDGEVTIDEVLLGIDIALTKFAADACGGMGSGDSGRTTVEDLVDAVHHATTGCEANMPTPTPTATPTMPVCVADGTAVVVASSAVPTSGAGSLQITCVTAENAGGSRSDLTRVSGRGTINGEDLLLQVYFVTATGAIDTISYGWIPSPGIPDLFDNLAFCNAPGCTGAALSLATKTITLSDTQLASDAGQSAVLNGTITLDRLPPPVATPTPPCPGGSTTLTLSNLQGTNSSQPLPATLTLGTAMNFSRSAEPPVFAYLSALYDGCPMAFPRLTLGFQFSGAPIEAGATYQVGSAQGQLNQIELREEGFSNFKSWEAQSGTLIVDAADGTAVAFRIVDASMRPKDAGTRGTFVLNATGSLAVP